MSIPESFHILFGVLFLSYLYLLLQVARFQYDSARFTALEAKKKDREERQGLLKAEE